MLPPTVRSWHDRLIEFTVNVTPIVTDCRIRNATTSPVGVGPGRPMVKGPVIAPIYFSPAMLVAKFVGEAM